MEDNEVENEPVAPPGEGPRRRVHIGLAALDRMLQRQPEELLLQITSRASGFPDALEDAQLLSRSDGVAKVLAVLASALQSSTNAASRIHLLNTVRTSALMTQHLSAFFTRMPAEHHGPRQRIVRRAIKDFLLLYRQLLTQFNEGVTSLRHLLIILQYVINDLRTNTNVVDDEIEDALADVSQRAEELEQQGRERREEQQTTDAAPGGRRRVKPPPNDFREMSIFPDVRSDIHATAKPFLRENIVKGAYEDAEHYLDVQFRLLREDFIRPLRNGIQEYMGLRDDGDNPRVRRRKLTDVRIYHDVAILNPVCTPGGIQHRIRFDVSRLGHVRWRYSKRLIYGSLVCLSSDDFASIRIASVAHRDPEHLQDGELIVRFETDMDGIRLLPPTERFLMVETSAYFEAYRHVLLALQDSRELDVPFMDNIVLCNRDVEPPCGLLRVGG